MSKLKRRLWAGFLALSFALTLGGGALAGAGGSPITLADALALALEHNMGYALFLWEQDLAQRREALQKHPKVAAEVKPAGFEDGQLQGPQGSLTITVPLGRHMTLSGKMGVAVDSQGVDLRPTGTLILEYGLFALPKEEGASLSPEEELRREVNRLVLQVMDLLIELRQAIDSRDYAQAVLAHLEAKLAAAEQTPNYDDFELRTKLREQTAALGAAQERVDQLQLQLQTVLGTAEPAFYEPLIAAGVQEVDYALAELQEEVFAASAELRSARQQLERARTELELERKSKGWDLKVSGALQAGEDPDLSVGLSASKTLYPYRIILDELELAAAKAEHNLEAVEAALLGELRSSLQAIAAAEERIRLRAELVAAAEEDLELRQRQYAAGLVTELQVEEAVLAVQKAHLDYFHSELDYARTVAELWNLCGRDLTEAVLSLIG